MNWRADVVSCSQGLADAHKAVEGAAGGAAGRAHLPAAQQLIIEQMEGAADAIAAGIANAHMQRGATQMKPREVSEKGQRYSETKIATER